MSATRTPRIYDLLDKLASLEGLDAPAELLAGKARSIIPSGPVKDGLSGSWLGHPLHPLLVQLPLGSWTSAVTLDWLGGRAGESGADRLIAVGLLATPPVAASGWSDWADTTVSSASVRRIGLVHALSNAAGTVLFGASLALRARGARGRGKALALAGMGALAAGGYLGGHLSYGEGVGVDRTTFERPPDDWTPAIAEAELAEGEPRRVEVAGVAVLLVRDGGRLHALSDRCAHRGGPLHRGKLSDGCIECPWHGSVFRLEDGALRRGPAAFPQPAWETRVVDGTVELRGPQPA